MLLRTLSVLALTLATLFAADTPNATGPSTASTPEAAAPTTPRVVDIDVTREAGPVNRTFQVCVGAGRANEGLRAEWQKQLAEVHRACGFTYIRMHGLFTDDMRVYSEDKQGHPIYNWQYVDMLYDYLESIGMKPFVELGFMPDALASGTQTCFWWKGNVTLPKDWQKWEDFIRATVAHWQERYGAEEVKTWYFEVWNEPNLNFFFAGTQADYFKLYEATARAIKAVNPAYRVGGPATAGAAWAPEFLAYCAAHHVPVDFVATHTYAVDQGFVDQNGDTGTVLSPNPQSIAADVHKVRAEIDRSAFPHLPLHFTEWSASYTPADPIHDSYHSAAFIVDRLRKVGADAASMSYWVFTDIFEEPGPRMTPFHGGFGLVNYQDIKKPAFYAYEYLAKLGPTELQCSDPSTWIAKDSTGAVQALVWDFTYTSGGKGVNNQEYYTRDLPPAHQRPLHLAIHHLRPGKYALLTYRVGYRVNDPYTTYYDLGRPSQLTREQVDFIKRSNDGAPVAQALVTVGADGTFEHDDTIRDNDLCLFELKPL